MDVVIGRERRAMGYSCGCYMCVSAVGVSRRTGASVSKFLVWFGTPREVHRSAVGSQV